jgi:hypothetical protein
MAEDTFVVGSDTYVVVRGLKDYQGNFVNNATVTGVLQNGAGVPVTGVGAITFTYVPDSNGDYDAVIPSTAAYENMKIHQLILTVVSGDKTLITKVRRIAKIDES